MLVRPCQTRFTCEMPLRLRLQMRDDAGPCGSDQATARMADAEPNTKLWDTNKSSDSCLCTYLPEGKDRRDGSGHRLNSRFGYSLQHFYQKILGGTCNVRRSLGVLARLAVLWRTILLRLRRGNLERLFEIGNDIVNMLCSHRYANQVLQSRSA